MYIPAFWVGVLGTLIVEVTILIGFALFSNTKKHK